MQTNKCVADANANGIQTKNIMCHITLGGGPKLLYLQGNIMLKVSSELLAK